MILATRLMRPAAKMLVNMPVLNDWILFDLNEKFAFLQGTYCLSYTRKDSLWEYDSEEIEIPIEVELLHPPRKLLDLTLILITSLLQAIFIP
jgi:hypothetical protein